MEEQVMLSLLDRFENLVNKNRLVEIRRLVEREIENLQGITEQKCKAHKINKDYCKRCSNLNCNLNNNENERKI